MKGLRVAGVCTLDQANRYLESEYLAWWNQNLVVPPADAADAHRPLGKEHDLAAILSHVEQRQVTNDYTVRYQGQVYQIDRRDIQIGMRKGWVRVEYRLDGSIAVQFQGRYLRGAPLHAARRTCTGRNHGRQTVAPNPQAQTQKRLDEKFLDSVGPFSS